MFNAIHDICDRYFYVPVLTEIQGISLVGVGLTSLSLGLLGAVEDRITGHKKITYYYG